MEQVPNIIQALESPVLFGPVIGSDLSSWAAWLTFLKTLYGLPLEDEDLETFVRCTDRDEPLAGGYPESYVICGRRGGKSRIVSIICAWEALFGDWSSKLSPGEKGQIFVIATDKKQAGIVLGYIRSILKLFPDLIEREGTEEIVLKNNISISVKTCTFRASRGFSTVCVIADELAFWRSEESANPAAEVLTSILPGLLEGAKLIGISTPYGKIGYIFQMWKDYFGKASDILVWTGSTKTMNPTFSDAVIRRLIARDPVAMRAEFNGEFREDVSEFIPLELLTAAATRQQSLPDLRNRYVAFCDPSGGRCDSMTLSVVHAEGEKIICDRCEEHKSPFDPAEVVKDFSMLLKAFGISKCTSDRFGGAWVDSAFAVHNIRIETSDLSASDIYLNFQPLLSMGKIELLNNDRLILQFQQLERRTAPGGRDRVDHPPNSHDDLANAVAGSCVFAARNNIMTLAEMEKYLPIRGPHHIPRFIENAGEQKLEDEMSDFLGGGKIIR